MKRDYPEHPIIGVGAVVVQAGRVLLVRRDTEPLRGEWSVPGGMLELGEKLRDGIRREVQEETGLEVEVGEVLDVFDSIFTDALGRTQYHYVLIDYLCKPLSGEAQAASDVSDVRWVSSRGSSRNGTAGDRLSRLSKRGWQSRAKLSVDWRLISREHHVSAITFREGRNGTNDRLAEWVSGVLGAVDLRGGAGTRRANPNFRPTCCRGSCKAGESGSTHPELQ